MSNMQIGIRPQARGSFPTAMEIESLFGAPAKGRVGVLFEDAEHTDVWLCVGAGHYWRVGPMGLWAALERPVEELKRRRATPTDNLPRLFSALDTLSDEALRLSDD